jgi:purine nucleoside permease
VARFTIQATLQYELGGVDIPTDFETGYFHQGSQSPNDTIGYLYDSEVYEVNAELRDAVAAFIDDSVLVDTPDAQAYRKHYGKDPDFQIGASKPGVRKCDGISSDTWFSGKVIADSFDDRASAWTDGQSRYCCTAQEDGATATALLRAHVAGKVDYSRLILARTSNALLQTSLVFAQS